MVKCEIVNATLDDMHLLINGADSEGWNPGLFDSVPFYFSDPNGFFIEMVDNKPIGFISAVAYDDLYGFMGFYIVLPEFRKQGYGIKLWNHAINYLGNRTIGLDGVVAQQNNYKKSGFDLYYKNIRFGGKLEGKISIELHEIKTVPFTILLEYDFLIYGVKRAAFLQHWITMPNSYGLVKMENNKVLGYGVIRVCQKGCKIGPLFADNQQIANEIFLALVAKYQKSDILFDVPEKNHEALDLAKKYELENIFETARMYKGPPPKQLVRKIFGVTTFELG